MDRDDNTLPDPAEDRLSTVKAIAEFIGETERRTQYLCERRLIPCGKIGNRYEASKRYLRKYYARVGAGEGRAAQ